MKETQALIERVRQISDTHQQLHITVEPSLSSVKPGQSVLARVSEEWTPYLREQWWPVLQQKNTLIVERPVNIRYEPGSIVSLIGLIGDPFRFRRTLRNVLLIAYNAEPTPLLLTIPALLGNKVSVTLLLLGTDYDTHHLPPEVEVIQGEVKEGAPTAKLDWPNRVTSIGWADQVFVTVSQEDELSAFREIWGLFSELRADIPVNYLFGVFRPLLPCGVGACSSCMVKLKGNSTALMCKDGPAIDLTKVPLS
jgi:Iron-sulfur cluster binding domain of dihydroorotate dehydrogenase B